MYNSEQSSREMLDDLLYKRKDAVVVAVTDEVYTQQQIIHKTVDGAKA